MEQLAGLGLPSGQVQGGAQGVPAGGGNDGVHLRVDRAAQLIPLAAGDPHGLPGAAAQIHAVLPAPRGPVVAGGDDLIVIHDDGPIAPAQAGGALQHGLRDVQIVIFLVDASHGASLPGSKVSAGSIAYFCPSGKKNPAQNRLSRPHRPGYGPVRAQFTFCLRLIS